MKYIEAFSRMEKEKLFVFSMEDLIKFFPTDKSTLKQQLLYWRSKGWIKSLKKGLYEIVYPKRKDIPDLFVANRIYAPSYVSLETALSYYSIIPEVAMGVTSVTPKPTREFKNHYGLFLFRSIKKGAFQGYRIIEERGFKIKIAEPEKALVDYIYFKLRNKQKLDLVAERFEKLVLKELKKERVLDYASVFNRKVYRAIRRLYVNL